MKSVGLPGWVDLQNELWSKHRNGYQMLQGRLENALSSENTSEYLSNSLSDLNTLMEVGMKSEIFQKLLKDTEDYKNWLEDTWSKNKDTITKELKDILKIELPQNPIDILVVSNKMKCGEHLGKGLITWGHSEDWNNYSLVYLAHEYLHDVFASGEISHSLIELATDNELRLRLNKEGEYFYINKKLVGHEYLFETEKKILPYWQEFLKNKDKNAHEFLKEQITLFKKDN